MLLCPNEISISHILDVKPLSVRNLAKIDIQNINQSELSTFLDEKKPYDIGIEPGSFAYVDDSNISFVRNSCIDMNNFSNQESKDIYLNPKYEYSNMLQSEDVLLCKDANIGDACIFLSEKEQQYVISSGVVKLNFNSNDEKYYCLAFLRDEYFRHQLDALTPRGSTIRHSGGKFLKCKIPNIGTKEKGLIPIIKDLLKNISYSERYSEKKLNESNYEIGKELICYDIKYENPSAKKLLSSLRVDAGFFSEVVQRIEFNINEYKHGYSTLEEHGFIIKRGPNLQKRDLGRSIKSDEYKNNYHLLVYPSDISDNGYILKEVYIGARNPVWYLHSGDILFSAEGTVGKVFVICDEKMKFITNIHGIIISPNQESKALQKSIMLGLFLHFLRSNDYFDKISVGGQGGSYAVNYWSKLRIPNFSESLISKVSPLYYSGVELDPTTFSHDSLLTAGVFELNQFRIQCSELLKKIIKDIKKGNTQNKNYYLNYLK